MEILTNPREIESKSFRIIAEHLAGVELPEREKAIVTRVIHATVDLTYATELIIHPAAVDAGLNAIRSGKNIITDATMVRSGVNKKLLATFGGEALCFLNDEGVIKEAKETGLTRSMLAMRKAAEVADGAIIAIGNAPTALFEICELVKKGLAKPALIVGVPIGFVGAAESKEELLTLDIPYITNKGRKGGSSVAASTVNAILKIAAGNNNG